MLTALDDVGCFCLDIRLAMWAVEESATASAMRDPSLPLTKKNKRLNITLQKTSIQ